MPTSSKPRKPHRGVYLPGARMAAVALTDILIRGFRGWSRKEKETLGFFFLEPFGALRVSKGTDEEARQYFANAKARLVLAYGISYALPRKTSGEPERERIADANWALQVAYDCYATKRRMLYPQLKHAHQIAVALYDRYLRDYTMDEVEAARRSLTSAESDYYKVEAELDARLARRIKG